MPRTCCGFLARKSTAPRGRPGPFAAVSKDDVARLEVGNEASVAGACDARVQARCARSSRLFCGGRPLVIWRPPPCEAPACLPFPSASNRVCDSAKAWVSPVRKCHADISHAEKLALQLAVVVSFRLLASFATRVEIDGIAGADTELKTDSRLPFSPTGFRRRKNWMCYHTLWVRNHTAVLLCCSHTLTGQWG